MNYFAITEPPSKKFVRLTLEKMGWGPEDFKKFSHHKHSGEDFLSISKKYPIFAVGDGVTLIQYLLEKKEYPNPSPAGEVAKIFCDSVIREAECRYKNKLLHVIFAYSCHQDTKELAFWQFVPETTLI